MIPLLFSIFLACTSTETPTHTVVQGDTLSKLAQSYNCSVNELRSWNNIDGDLIEVGQVLIVGTEKAAPSKNKAKRSSKSTGPRLPHRVINVADIKSPRKRDNPRPMKPKPKACLILKDAQLSDQQMIGSRGLSENQIKGSIEQFFPQLEDCLMALQQSGSLRLEFTIGCDGLVDKVEALESNIDAGSEKCITERFLYTSFPAHGLPKGEVFEYPLMLNAAQ